MVSRRTVLQGAIATTSLPIIAGMAGASSWRAAPPAAAPTAALDHPALYKVLFDRRFAAARAFGRDAQWRGESVHAFDGDITEVWYHDLYPRWQQGRAAIAGLTAHGALFCLEHLARDARMRVIQRVEHRYPKHETLYSWVIA
jgi:hypothetical protein